MISRGMGSGRVRRRNESKAKDPHQLRVNSYRVLLTRGRDGFIVFVPNEIGMRSTYEALKGAGVRELIMLLQKLNASRIRKEIAIYNMFTSNELRIHS